MAMHLYVSKSNIKACSADQVNANICFRGIGEFWRAIVSACFAEHFSGQFPILTS